MTFGLDEFGLTVKRLDDVKTQLQASFRAKFGQNVNLDEQSVNGVEIGILSEQIADAWEALEDAYAAAYRDFATGVHLDRIAQLVGLTRGPATRSVVGLILSGTNGTVIPAGSRVSDGDTLWETAAEVTISGGTAEVDASPADYGPVAATAGTLTTIDTPVSGWVSVTNPLDADLGQLAEKDAALRLRIFQRRVAAGSSKLAGVMGAVANAEVDGVKVVTEVQGFENVSVDTDADGRPGKSFEILVAAAAGTDIDDAIAQAIWDAKPAGIEAYGVGSSGTAVDSEGDNHTVLFSRPAAVDVYVTAELEVNDEYPIDGDDLVAAEILAYEDKIRSGRDVAPFAIAQLVETPGIDTLVIKLGTSPSPSSTEVLAIGPRERAALDSTRIVVSRS